MRAALRMQDERITDLCVSRARPDPIPLSPPANATEKQRAAWFTYMNELKARCRASKVSRGWTVSTFTTSPAGTVPLVMLVGAKHVRLVIDLRGGLRLADGAKMGAVVSVSEAAAIARGD